MRVSLLKLKVLADQDRHCPGHVDRGTGNSR
jgi:hypothetical protein